MDANDASRQSSQSTGTDGQGQHSGTRSQHGDGSQGTHYHYYGAGSGRPDMDGHIADSGPHNLYGRAANAGRPMYPDVRSMHGYPPPFYGTYGNQSPYHSMYGNSPPFRSAYGDADIYNSPHGHYGHGDMGDYPPPRMGRQSYQPHHREPFDDPRMECLLRMAERFERFMHHIESQGSYQQGGGPIVHRFAIDLKR